MASGKKTRTKAVESNDPMLKYKKIYFETSDRFINHLFEKFFTNNYTPLIGISKLLTSAVKPDIVNLFFDLKIYRGEVDFNCKTNELNLWFKHKSKNDLKLDTVKKVQEYFQQLKHLQAAFPNMLILLKIFLTVPVSRAEAERSFSVLKKIKELNELSLNELVEIGYGSIKNFVSFRYTYKFTRACTIKRPKDD